MEPQPSQPSPASRKSSKSPHTPKTQQPLQVSSPSSQAKCPRPSKRSGKQAKNAVAEQGSSKKKLAMSWSGGKDSSLALHYLLRDARYEVVCLMTTVDDQQDSSSIHSIPVPLLQEQAACIGLPLELVRIPAVEKKYFKAWRIAMEDALRRLHRERGITCVGFGDLFAEDTCEFRYRYLKQCGMEGVFPLWKRDTRELLDEFLGLDFKAMVCCVDDEHLVPDDVLGQVISPPFLASLPKEVDPCGEHGEFHSFVFDGPIFRRPVRIRQAGKHSVQKRVKCFHFLTLLPGKDGEEEGSGEGVREEKEEKQDKEEVKENTDTAAAEE